MRVLTWNVWGLPGLPKLHRRLHDISNHIQNLLPDIVGLQEVIAQECVVSFRPLEDFTYFDGKGEYVETEWIPGYSREFLAHLGLEKDFFPHTEPEQKQGGYQLFHEPVQDSSYFNLSGLLSMVNKYSFSKISKLESKTYDWQGDTWSWQYFDKLIEKGYHALRLHHPEMGAFTFMNTHLVSPSPVGNFNDHFLEQQSYQLIDDVKKRLEKGEPLVLSGDFNFRRHTAPYLRSLHLADIADLDYGTDNFHLYFKNISHNFSDLETRATLNLSHRLAAKKGRERLNKKGFCVDDLHHPQEGKILLVTTSLLSHETLCDYRDKRFKKLLIYLNENKDQKMILIGENDFDEYTPYYKELTDYLYDCTAETYPADFEKEIMLDENMEESRGLDYIFTSQDLYGQAEIIANSSIPLFINNKLVMGHQYPSDHDGLYVDIKKI